MDYSASDTGGGGKMTPAPKITPRVEEEVAPVAEATESSYRVDSNNSTSFDSRCWDG